VIDEGETMLEGLTREVLEETGLRVTSWEGPVYEVHAEAPDQGWRLRVEVHRALAYEGDLVVDDPDGIVVDARFVPLDDCATQLAATWIPTHEPLLSWLAERFTEQRAYRYLVEGHDPAAVVITRL
jgi:8-oxo-dGTP pyrophosphatase MutT (NUDIX family)